MTTVVLFTFLGFLAALLLGVLWMSNAGRKAGKHPAPKVEQSNPGHIARATSPKD
jgi:hypothetical protein